MKIQLFWGSPLIQNRKMAEKSHCSRKLLDSVQVSRLAVTGCTPFLRLNSEKFEGTKNHELIFCATLVIQNFLESFLILYCLKRTTPLNRSPKFLFSKWLSSRTSSYTIMFEVCVCVSIRCTVHFGILACMQHTYLEETCMNNHELQQVLLTDILD